MKTSFLIRFYASDGDLSEAIQAFQIANSEIYPSMNEAIKFLLKKALTGLTVNRKEKAIDLTKEQQRSLVQKIKDLSNTEPSK